MSRPSAQIGKPVATKDRILQNTRLVQGVQSDNMWLIKDALKSGASPDARTRDGTPVLIEATLRGNLRVVRYLVTATAKTNTDRKGADVTAGDKWGDTALHHATNTLQKKIAVYLVRNGANPDQQNRKGWTSLMVAADKGSDFFLQLLSSASKEINKKNNHGKTALRYAFDRNCATGTRILLKAGARTDVDDWRGKSFERQLEACTDDAMRKVFQTHAAAQANLRRNEEAVRGAALRARLKRGAPTRRPDLKK